MEIERAREDALVAGVAGVTTIAIALLSSFTGVVSVATLPTLAPLAVYAVYLFSRKGGPYGTVDTARNWAVAAAGVGALVLLASAAL
ncbi:MULTISPECIES: hypothetical protein [Halorubrum]|uniref:DUF8049 domain-containing protein n=1 Tax=Halorubrum sodomense TaxID=35743 RepID=A0A1I6GQF3_HALSD|nr:MULTISPECIES: hypothetical protein [Halorubrum]TKX55192.1 hypothetical protein EXE42_04340 [Halorubrum sp. SP3]TKX70252.1 hypothetical protein EXE45_05455 [Halorubrum sp. SP9]SFR44424.1 hypothetical protein SAMN04487937_1962 [Halorubrum sodomense]